MHNSSMSRMATRLWPPPWYPLATRRDRATPVGQLRRFYRELYWSNIPLWKVPLVPFAVVLWPLVLLATSLARDLPRHGARAKAISGRGYLAQAIDHLWIGMAANLWPHQYYAFELFRPDLRHRGYEYLRRIETKRALYKLLRIDHREEDRFHDKLRFFQACERVGVRSAPVLMAAENGRMTFPAHGASAQGSPALPATDLFVKPQKARGGRGAAVFIHESGRHVCGQHRVATAAELVRALKALYGDTPVIVQPRLAPHPALQDVALNALPTVRIVTVSNEAGHGEFVAAAFRVASNASSIIDNFHAGGLAASVDPASGRLGAATDMGTRPSSAWHDRHPITGGQIEGRILPSWPAVVRLAETAHSLLADRVVLGWDIAMLPDGPCIIEANSFPDLNILQRAGLEPLGNGRLGQMMLHHIRRIHPAL
jgi:hypothetical protein